MSEHWPVSNEGVGMPPQPLERENARLRAALRTIAYPDPDQAAFYDYNVAEELALAALGDQIEEAEDG